MEMSDLVVYCQPRSKEKDRFGKDTPMPVGANDGLPINGLSFGSESDSQRKDFVFCSVVHTHVIGGSGSQRDMEAGGLDHLLRRGLKYWYVCGHKPEASNKQDVIYVSHI